MSDLESTGAKLEELAQLCEAHVEEAGRRIGDILALAQTQSVVVAEVCLELSKANVMSGVEHTAADVQRYLAGAASRSAESRRVLGRLAERTESVRGACRQVEQSSVSTRVLTLQTRIEGVRMQDAGHVGSTAKQVGALNRELTQVTGRMRELLDDFDTVLRAFRLIEGQALRSKEGFVRGVTALAKEVTRNGEKASAELEAFANRVSNATRGLVGRTGEALSSLQFQDPLTQELRSIRAGMQTADPNLDALLARVERATGEAVTPLYRSRTTLSELHDATQSGLQVLSGFSSRYRGEHPLSSAVEHARRTLETEARRLLAHMARMHELVTEAEGICTSLIEAETQIRFVSEQTRLVAANAAIKAARVGGKGRATSVIASEMSRLNVRVCLAADRVHDRTGDVQALLPALVERAERAKSSTTLLVEQVLGVFEAASGELGQLEVSLRRGLRGQPDVIRQIAQMSNQAIQVLEFDAVVRSRIDQVVSELKRRGAVNRGLADVRDVIGEVPDEHPVEAGEFLMF